MKQHRAKLARRSSIIETSGGRKQLSLTAQGSAYFLALQGIDLATSSLPYLQDTWTLVALNYLIKGGEVDAASLARLDAFINSGKHVYLDSGCFSLAFAYAKEHSMTAPDVFMLPPRELPFFEAWYATYIRIVPQLVDRLWGVVEIDFGSPEDRAATRARIARDTGVRPIPVFRFGKDPVSLFERLVSTHDRVCLGGLAKVTPAFRNMALPLLRDIQHRANPSCWIHVLGVSASGAFSASGFTSCDASTYANAARFGLTCGYTHQGFTHAADWTPKPPRAGAVTDAESRATDFSRYLGMFQHSVMNLGRTAHLRELSNAKLV
jgi:hypothetical protein